MIRLLICLISAFFISLSVGWWFIIHVYRTVGVADQNVNSFMWSVIAAGFLATAALTWLFYRLIH
jgi:hypothetical protein